MFCSKSCSHTLWYVTLLSVFYTFGINAGYQQNKECGDFDFQNDMRFFDHSTSHFVRWLQRDSDPDEIFKEVISRWNDKTADVKSKVAYYEWPFLVVSGTLVFLALATFIAGFAILFYANWKKKDKTGIRTTDKTGNIGYMLILAVVSCFLILTDICLFISNNRLSENLPRIRKTLLSSIDDLQNFQNTTEQELDHILRNDFDKEVGGSLKQFEALADCSSGGLDSVLKKRKLRFKKASESVLSGLYKTRDILSRVNMTLNELQRTSNRLRSELGKINFYFKEVQRLCSGWHPTITAGNICKKFVNEDYIFSNDLPQTLPNNVTEVVFKLDKFLKHKNFTSVNEILNVQEDIEWHLCEERANKLKELEKLSNGIRIARGFTLDTVKKYSKQLAEHTLIPAKTKIGLSLGQYGNIGRYDQKRWWLSFFVILAVLLTSLITIFSVVLKHLEPFITRFPSNITQIVETKKLFLWLPRRILLGSTVANLSMAVVVNLCAGIAFLVVSNMALVCDISSKYEKIDNIFDTSSLLQDTKLFSKEKIKTFKLFKKFSECPEDGTIWDMFNLDDKFDINDSINQLNGIPRIAARFFEDGHVLHRTNKTELREFHEVLQEWKDIGLENINISILAEQVDNPISMKSYRKLSEALLSSYQDSNQTIENMTRTPFKMFQSISNRASVIEDDYVKMYSVLSKLLSQHLKSFNKSREQITANFANMNDIYSDIVGGSITQTENEVVDQQVIKTVKVIKNFMKESVNKVRNEVGRCGPVKQAYNKTACLFCRDVFGSWNSWWILLLTCGFLMIFSVIFCFLTLKPLS